MIIDESAKDKLKNSLKFDFSFRTGMSKLKEKDKVRDEEKEEAKEKGKITSDQIIYTNTNTDINTNNDTDNNTNINTNHIITTNLKSPTTPIGASSPKHDYSDSGVYYVCRDFFATNPEHLSVFVDDELSIIEEIPGGKWTRVREKESQNTGLIPTDILESGAERLAKENKTSNQDTIRVMSCGLNPDSGSTSTSLWRKSKCRKSVSFCETDPEVINYPPGPDDHLLFLFTLDEDTSKAIAPTEATLEDESPRAESTVDSESAAPEKKPGFFSKFFNKSKPSDSQRILETLKTFQNYPDHLIRVYTGNYDSTLHAYKTFIVDETLTFGEFSQMVLGAFELDLDGHVYEVNLINHLTAEMVPLDLDFTIEQVIELTKREGIPFNSRMPSKLKKAQNSALKRLESQMKKSRKSTPRQQQQQLQERDKSTDYVTPFKFVLNRIYSSSENVPIHVHLSLACSNAQEGNLILTSLFPALITAPEKKKKKWFKFKSKSVQQPSDIPQIIHRIPTTTQTPLHVLLRGLLETLEIPKNLPGIVFEASLPAIHDATELPLPLNMPIGQVLKIRPKLDPAEQIIIIRPVIIDSV